MHVGCYVDGICVNNIIHADNMVLLAPSVNALRQMTVVCEPYARSHRLTNNVQNNCVSNL